MTPETQALLMKAEKSLSACKLLCEEGYYDFSASRAYYAMFYAAEALLLDRGQSYSKHAAVVGAFGKEFTQSGQIQPRFHRFLIDAQDFRNQGDYGLGPQLSEAKAKEIIAWAFLDVAKQKLTK
jgi:uncharacterized protein (UPF0332 family)